jgi:hypothetical protein
MPPRKNFPTGNIIGAADYKYFVLPFSEEAARRV